MNSNQKFNRKFIYLLLHNKKNVLLLRNFLKEITQRVGSMMVFLMI